MLGPAVLLAQGSPLKDIVGDFIGWHAYAYRGGHSLIRGKCLAERR